MNKRKILSATCLMLLLICTCNIQAVQVLEQKIISNQVTDCDMHWMRLIFNDSGNVLITMKRLLYVTDNLIRTDNLKEYCCNILGSFVQDNRFYIVLDGINTVDVYKVQKQIELVSSIEPLKSSGYPSYDEAIAIPENNNFYYLLGEYYVLPLNPVEHIRTQMLAGEHGVYYKKPLLAEIQNNKMVRHIKLPYGGNIDESYMVQEAISGKDSVHLFGFRNVDVPFIGKLQPIRLVQPGESGYHHKKYTFDTGDYYVDRDITQSIMLYYSDYNFKRGRNTRKYKIYENIPGYNEKTDTYCDYGVLSADTKDDNVFAVFSWVQQQRRRAEGFNINNISSNIYYWQCNDKSYGKAEEIAEGFCPIVKVDQFGVVHVFWLDRGGNIIQKIKKNGKWGDEEIILNGFSTKPIIYTKGYCSSEAEEKQPEAILYTKFFAAEFDNDNNLHTVYPTAEGIVYTKLKLE